MVSGNSVGGNLRREAGGKAMRTVAGPNCVGKLRSYMVGCAADQGRQELIDYNNSGGGGRVYRRERGRE